MVEKLGVFGLFACDCPATVLGVPYAATGSFPIHLLKGTLIRGNKCSWDKQRRSNTRKVQERQRELLERDWLLLLHTNPYSADDSAVTKETRNQHNQHNQQQQY